GEKIKEKDLMPKYIKDIEIEELCQKIVFALTETSEIDYGNKELKQQIFNIIEVVLESKKIEKKEVEKSELKSIDTNSENQSKQKMKADYTGQDFKTRKSKEKDENDFEDIETEVQTNWVLSLKDGKLAKITMGQRKSDSANEQKEKVRPSKVVQTMKSKGDNNKEDGPSSYITEKKKKKNE
ncbi:32070_t:CDS:2, partial [Gigaspora margarita]